MKEFSSRQHFNTHTPWEDIVSFSRAVRMKNHIYVSGTTATGPNGIVGKGDPAKQMEFILDRIEQAIVGLGGQLKDVVRTRIYVANIEDWEVVAKIHGERFKTIRPACCLVEARLIGEFLVEVEADAVLE